MVPSAPRDDVDDGMDTLMDAFKIRKYNNAFSESNWEEEFDKIPLFMKTSPGEIIDPVKHPDMARLQAMLHDDCDGTPEEQATGLKDEGNAHFKEKNYRKAIASYTAGLEANRGGGDRDLDAVLLTNRAAAHSRLGDARSALSDATAATEAKPGHLKALVRSARCCAELGRFAEATWWCDAGLEGAHPADATLLEARAAADGRRRAAERDARKARATEKKERRREEDLLAAIKKRGIKLLRAHENDSEDGETITPDGLFGSHEATGGARVFLDERGGALHWPVRFLYPEHRQSDLISAFRESDRFSDHLAVMFGEELPPPWDADRKYRPESLQLFLEDCAGERGRTVYRVDPEAALLAVLRHERCFVEAGTPSFVVLVRGSAFCEHFLTGKTVKRL